jgi:hypothetical protein
MKTIFSILFAAVMASVLGWGFNEITFQPPEDVQPSLTLFTKAEMPKEVVSEILERHRDFILSAATFDGATAVKNASFPDYLLFHGSLVAVGIILFLGIRRFTTNTSKAEPVGAGQPATRPVVEPEGGDKPQPEAEGRSR